MERNNTDNLFVSIYKDLKLKIQEFEYKPGDRLSEPSLAKQYNISRTPIKRALGLLESEGIVYVTPSVGTFISKINTEHLSEYFTMRIILELGILDEYKQNHTEEDTKKLLANLQEQQDLVDNYCDENSIESSKKFWFLDNQFHEIIFTAVNKKFLWDHIVSQSMQANRFRVLSVSLHQDDLHLKVKDHNKIFKYLYDEIDIDIKNLYNNHLFETLDTNLLELKEAFPEYFEQDDTDEKIA